jgi:hypothetical protein
MTVLRELARYKLGLVRVQKVAPNLPENTHFSMERGMSVRYMFFLCKRESYQQLRGLSLLVIGCHT